MKESNQNHENLCLTCPAVTLCLPAGLTGEDLIEFDQLVKRRKPVKREQYLFRQGETFQNLYAIHEGCFKENSFTPDGRERIHGFYMSGELIGLSAVCRGRYTCSIQTIEAGVVCEISFNRLLHMAESIPALQKQIIFLMSRQLQTEIRFPKNCSAMELLATFLLNITERIYHSAINLQVYCLPMSRQDIASFLGLSVETISRTFTQMQKDRTIKVSGKKVYINDRSKLQKLFCGEV